MQLFNFFVVRNEDGHLLKTLLVSLSWNWIRETGFSERKKPTSILMNLSFSTQIRRP